MQIEPLAIPDVKLITPKKFGDHRGFFSETYSRRAFEEAGLNLDFVQDNHSLSGEVGVLRGLHFQTPPHAQGKLVRVTRGGVLDVAVDIRQGSPWYGQHVAVELSADNWQQLWVPPGFAHGFVTREPNTEFLYKVTGLYAPECDSGLIWNDPALGIDWGIEASLAKLSDKDTKLGGFENFESPFVYEA